MSNQANKFNERLSRPQTIAGAIGGLLKKFGIRASDADLISRWSEIMGPEVSGVARIIAIKKTKDNKFNIIIKPVNPAYALELSYMTAEIQTKINKYFGRDAVQKITIRK